MQFSNHPNSHDNKSGLLGSDNKNPISDSNESKEECSYASNELS